MQVYFENYDSLIKTGKTAQEVGKIVGNAFKKYIEVNGVVTDKVKKNAILEELRTTAQTMFNLPQTSMLTLSFPHEIKQILETKVAKKYLSHRLTGPQRIEFSLLAEKEGLVSYKTVETFGKEDVNYLVIGGSADEKVDKTTLTDKQKELFSHYMNILLNNDTFLQEVEMLGLSGPLDLYIDELQRYSYHGFWRRNRNVSDSIVSVIKKSPKYKEIMEGKGDIRSEIEPFVVTTELYIQENHNKEYIELDVIGAISTAYHLRGIYAESWNDFLGKFTKSKFLMVSKKFRLEIFGKLDSYKKNGIMHTKIIIDVWNSIKHKYGPMLLSLYGDALILHPTGDIKCAEVVNELTKLIPSYISLSCFQLRCYDIVKDLHLPSITRKANSVLNAITTKKVLKDVHNKIFTRVYSYPIGKRFDVKCAEGDMRTKIHSIIYSQEKSMSK